MAIPIVYESCLSDDSLTAAVQNFIEVQQQKEEQEKQIQQYQEEQQARLERPSVDNTQ